MYLELVFCNIVVAFNCFQKYVYDLTKILEIHFNYESEQWKLPCILL